MAYGFRDEDNTIPTFFYLFLYVTYYFAVNGPNSPYQNANNVKKDSFQ